MNSQQEKALLEYFRNGHRREYIKGETILRGNDELQEIFYIESGFVKVYSINKQGEEYLHLIYKAGEIFPLIALLSGVKRNVFYVAMSKTTCLSTPKDEILTKLDANLFTNSFMRQIVQQFNTYADRVDNLEYKFARDRLIYRLLFLGGRFGVKTDDGGILLDAPLTQQAIADSINLSRESVSRELERLEMKGMISYQGRKIVICDVDTLCSQLQDPVRTDFWGLKTMSKRRIVDVTEQTAPITQILPPEIDLANGSLPV